MLEDMQRQNDILIQECLDEFDGQIKRKNIELFEYKVKDDPRVDNQFDFSIGLDAPGVIVKYIRHNVVFVQDE